MYAISRPAVMAPNHRTSDQIASGRPRANIGVDEFLRREVSLVGSYETGMTRPHPYWPWSRARNRAVILDLIERRQLQVQPLVSHVVPYTDAPAMYDLMHRGTEGWTVINFIW